MGTRISGAAICDSTEPSTYSTIECTTLCGWMTTDICSTGIENNQCASITSKPLLAMVAESTEIFLPITQLGCIQACSGVTLDNCCNGMARKGPPDAVKMSFFTAGCGASATCPNNSAGMH